MVRGRLTIAAGCIAGLLLARSVRAQCTNYSVEFMPSPYCGFFDTYADVTGINEAGAMSGSYLDCGATSYPVIWGPTGAVTFIPPAPGTDFPVVGDLNLAGEAAGNLDVPNLTPPDRPFRFSDDSTTVLGIFPGDNWAEAYAINSSGWVCGTSQNTVTGPLKAVVWLQDQTLALALPYGAQAVANDISDTGRVVGWMGNGGSDPVHAFIYDLSSGDVIDIGAPLPGTTNSLATAISSNGNVICGRTTIPCGRDCVQRKGFVWSDGKAEDLGVLPGLTNTWTWAVNDLSVVVGECDIPGGAKAFVWQNGVMQNLNDLIPAKLQVNVRYARGINNSGQIAANGRMTDGSGAYVGMRLTPIPSLPGDFNCDQIVNTADLLGVLNHWGFVGNTADFNHDGTVNVLDLVIVIQNWTQSRARPLGDEPFPCQNGDRRTSEITEGIQEMIP